MLPTITPARGAFLAHSNYIQAFDRLTSSHYVPKRGLFALFTPLADVNAAVAAAVRSSNVYSRLQRRLQTDTEEVIAILRNAWSTEFLLALTGEFAADEIVATANNWAVVQAYYATYHISQGLLVARGDARTHTHERGQAQFSAFWTRPSISLPPWSMAWGPTGCVNPPPNHPIQHLRNPWIACDDQSCWGLAAMALRTTREDTVKEQLKAARDRKRAEAKRLWLAEETARLARGKRPRKQPVFSRPLLSDGEKQQIEGRVRPYTILDYLYRLRIRSNYVDTTMFEDGPETLFDSQSVHESLCRITSTTLLVHELMVARLVGVDALRRAVDQWLGGARQIPATIGVSARRHLILH